MSFCQYDALGVVRDHIVARTDERYRQMREEKESGNFVLRVGGHDKEVDGFGVGAWPCRKMLQVCDGGLR